MSQVRKLITSWVGRLRLRADAIDRLMVGKTGPVILWYRGGMFIGAHVGSRSVDADALAAEPEE